MVLSFFFLLDIKTHLENRWIPSSSNFSVLTHNPQSHTSKSISRNGNNFHHRPRPKLIFLKVLACEMNLETLQAGFVGHMRDLNFKVDYNLFNVGLMKLPHFEMRDSALMFIQNTCCLCKPEQSEHEERKRTIVFDWFLDARDCERVGSFTWSRRNNKNISFLVLDIFCI